VTVERFAPTVSVSTHLIEVYLAAAKACALSNQCRLCAREAIAMRLELARRSRISREYRKRTPQKGKA